MQTITCYIKKLWEAKVTTPDVRPSKNSSSRKDRWEVKDLASTKMQLVEKTEDSKIEDTENLTSETKPAELRRNSDKAKTHNADQGKKSPPKDRVRKSLAGDLCSHEGQRICKFLGDILEREDSESAKHEQERSGGKKERQAPEVWGEDWK